jgi:nitrogen fixation NifU-like protein
MKKILSESTYSSIVLEHMHNPRNWGIIDQSDGYARVTGPCGDTMEISITVKDDTITKCTFDTDGCGATVSCGSIISEMATGKKVSRARRIDQTSILAFCNGLPQENEHCALLAARTLQEALEDFGRTRNDSWKKLYRTG